MSDINAIMRDYSRSMFRDFLAERLGPSPFSDSWPITKQQAEEIADNVEAKLAAEPDGGQQTMTQIMEKMYG